MFANDANTDGMFEHGIYKKMIGPFERKLTRGLSFLLPLYFEKRPLTLLLEHYRVCSTIMTSRYHALLTAAWAGCKIVALERSSKLLPLQEIWGYMRSGNHSAQLLYAFENANLLTETYYQI